MDHTIEHPDYYANEPYRIDYVVLPSRTAYANVRLIPMSHILDSADKAITLAKHLCGETKESFLIEECSYTYVGNDVREDREFTHEFEFDDETGTVVEVE